MKAAILSIGSEVTTGRIVDTNARWAADELTRRGIAVTLKLTVDDDTAAIRDAWDMAKARADLVWVTGGMGATVDDLTVEAFAGALETPLIRNEEVAVRVGEAYRRRGIAVPASAERQSLVPAGAEVLLNPAGLAPGIMLKRDGVTLVMLPGVPAEMAAIARESVFPRLESSGAPFAQRIVSVAGMPESLVDDRIRSQWNSLAAGERFALQAIPGEVILRMSVSRGTHAECLRRLDEMEAEVKEALGENSLAVAGARVEDRVIELLRASGRSVSAAESVTGGLVCCRLSAVPGASAVLRGGWVVYQNESKEGMLGIPARIIGAHGAVSAQTAQAMARAAREQSGSSVAVSVTGWAGPDGGTEGEPVGTIYAAFSSKGGEMSERFWFGGDRESVRCGATSAVLRLLAEKLENS